MNHNSNLSIEHLFALEECLDDYLKYIKGNTPSGKKEEDKYKHDQDIWLDKFYSVHQEVLSELDVLRKSCSQTVWISYVLKIITVFQDFYISFNSCISQAGTPSYNSHGYVLSKVMILFIPLSNILEKHITACHYIIKAANLIVPSANDSPLNSEQENLALNKINQVPGLVDKFVYGHDQKDAKLFAQHFTDISEFLSDKLRPADIDNLRRELESFFIKGLFPAYNKKPEKFIAKFNKKKLAYALGDLFYKMTNKELSFEYLKYFSMRFEIFSRDLGEHDDKTFHKSNLYIYFKSKNL